MSKTAKKSEAELNRIRHERMLDALADLESEAVQLSQHAANSHGWRACRNRLATNAMTYAAAVRGMGRKRSPK